MSDQTWRERYNFPAEQDLIRLVEANPGMYGSMMSIISQMWHEKDPIGAFTVGPCYRQVELYGNYFEVLDERDKLRQELESLKSQNTQFINFLKKRQNHAEAVAQRVKNDHGDEPSSTHTYYGGQNLGYWQGRLSAVEDMIDKMEGESNQ